MAKSGEAGPDPVDAALARFRGAKGRPARSAAIAEVAAAAHMSPRVLQVFHGLAALPDGHPVAVEYVARMPLPVAPGLLLYVAPMLQDKTVPVGLRLAAAAKLITALPDKPESVGPVARAVTAGLGTTRALGRLIQLQSRIEKSAALDKIVADAEASVKHRCPHCPAKLTRRGLAKHLWKRHKVLFDGGKCVAAGPHVEAAVAAAAANRTADGLDRVYLWAGNLYPGVRPAQVHQAILSRLGPLEGELAPLLAAAADDGHGLCPACHAAVPPAFLPVPPPLAKTSGRLAGEGYLIELRTERGARVVRATGPGGDISRTADAGRRVSPRSLGVRIAAVFGAAALVTASVLPFAVAKPAWVVIWLGMTAGAAYAAAVFVRKPLVRPTDRAVDAAWREVAPGVGRSPAAVKFLTRLCRTSLGTGTPGERTEVVWEMVEHAAVLAEKGGPYWQWLAAVRVLQAHDAGVLGKDWVNGLVPVFEPFLRGELPPAYADAAAEILLGADAFTDRDAGRLRVLVAAAGFDAGLTPTNFAALAPAAPAFAKLLAGPGDWLKQLFAVWRARNTKPWESVGPADAVFEFARKSMNASGKALAGMPDFYLIAKFDGAADDELGAILIGRKGVTVAGVTTADPDAVVAVETGKGGGSILAFGPHRIGAGKKLPERVAFTLKAWLKYRAEKLLPLADRPEGPGAWERVNGLISRAAATCPLCGTRCVAAPGEVGTAVG